MFYQYPYITNKLTYIQSNDSCILYTVCRLLFKKCKRIVVNDEKRCVVHVDEAPGLDQACTKGKRGRGGGGGVEA